MNTNAMDEEDRVNLGATIGNSLPENRLMSYEDNASDIRSAISDNDHKQTESVDKSQANNNSSPGIDGDSFLSAHSEPASNTYTNNEVENAEVTESEGNLEENAPMPTDEHDMEYQPTAEEIEAARMWEEVNNEDVQLRVLTDQERADAELALLLQAQFADGYNSDNDRDTAPESFECACGDSFSWQQALDMMTLNCGHVRCNDCLNQNVAVGLESKRNYPPRCCGIGIEVELVQDHLSDENILRWVAVKDEFEDRAPVYCAVKTCSVYLTKDTLDTDHKWALCPNCKVRTCSGCLCLQSDHIEAEKCPERIDKMNRELMTKKKWKPCPGCKHMIERIEGCDHMICECGEEFCYRCGRKYVGGMPCNCYGQRNWVDEEPEANDAAMQQQILNNLNRTLEEDEDETEDDDRVDGEGEEEEGVDLVDVNLPAHWIAAAPQDDEQGWAFGSINETDQATGNQPTSRPEEEH